MKLVRDKIPQIIIEDGRTPIYHVAGVAEHKRELFNKVTEELEEFRADPSLVEAADLVEAIFSLIEIHDLKMASVAKAGLA
ncbi:MAG: nucleoside triphosphate pyrophosphohydrolase, partial [Gammaproteobacteria bacterium]|nr:nucleoside triphosphate pyrophosphohydrolase [Gammaproteobacteria bacterium]